MSTKEGPVSTFSLPGWEACPFAPVSYATEYNQFKILACTTAS